MSLKRPPWMSRIDIVLFLGFTYSAVTVAVRAFKVSQSPSRRMVAEVAAGLPALYAALDPANTRFTRTNPRSEP